MLTLLAFSLAALPSAGAQTAPLPAPRSPGEIAAAAPAAEWIAIAPSDLLVMELATDARGRARRVLIQLVPEPVGQPWTDNVRRLAAARWWDGTSVNRVQDNYVAQWGDATEKKPLPTGLAATSPAQYEVRWAALPGAKAEVVQGRAADVYAASILWYRGFPLATDMKPGAERRAWPVHCYGTVGVGRNLAPDAGTGAELYAVIGHPPRHLDRNIAVVGRVIEGIEHLSSLPRGTGALGFYEQAEERVPITRVRLASELPAAERPRLAYLSTEGATWATYAEARRNRERPFFEVPAGAADVCNIPVPIKRLP